MLFMKTCKVCEEQKSTADFIKTTGGYRSPYCDECRKKKLKINNNRIKKLKNQFK